MKTPFIYLFSLFLCLANGLQAQTFSCRKLAEIGELFPKTCLPSTDSIFNCPQIIKEKSFVVQYNTKNEIEHLGVSLFSPEAKEMINAPICNFIERLMLELLLQKNTAKVNKKMQEYGVHLEEKNSLSGNNTIPVIQTLLDKLQQPVRFSLQQQDVIYDARWQLEGGEIFILTFPASRELIFGTNKKESDKTLTELLPENRCQKLLKNETPIQKNELESLFANTNIFIRKGDAFTLPELNSDTYYSQNATGKFNLVTDDRYPALFLKNILLIPTLETTLKLHIKHRMYGSFTPEFEIKPNDFTCFFQQDFDIYCHVDDTKQDTLKATVILYNKMFNYMHLLSITTPVNTLFQKNGVLQAEFYSNIPQHNIKNLLEN
jgi:hypothetical protein